MSETSDAYERIDSADQKDDGEVRDLIVSLIEYVAVSKAPTSAKHKALDAIDRLRVRVLP